jgi:hypothetical protein
VDDFHKSETVSWYFWAVETIFEEKSGVRSRTEKKISHGAFKSWTCQHSMAFLQGGPCQISFWTIFESYEGIFLSGMKIFLSLDQNFSFLCAF